MHFRMILLKQVLDKMTHYGPFQHDPVCDSMILWFSEWNHDSAAEPWIFNGQQMKPNMENEGFVLSDSWLHVEAKVIWHYLSALGVLMKIWLKLTFYYFLNPYIHAMITLSGIINLFPPHPQYSMFTTKTASTIMLTTGKYTSWD